MPRYYYIRIPDKAERVRAVRPFLDVEQTRYVYPGHVMAVTAEHIKALEREKIAFEYLYPTNSNDQATTPVQS